MLRSPQASSPSQSLRASSPKGGALGITVQFPVKLKSFRFRQSLSLWERWHGASRDGEGKDAKVCSGCFPFATPPVKMGFRKVRRLS